MADHLVYNMSIDILNAPLIDVDRMYCVARKKENVVNVQYVYIYVRLRTMMIHCPSMSHSNSPAWNGVKSQTTAQYHYDGYFESLLLSRQ